VAAPPLLAVIISTAGWRWVFFAVGAFGLLWTLWWLRSYFPAIEHPKLRAQERFEIQEVFAQPDETQAPISWLGLLSYREVWGLVLAKFLSDAGWYFYLFWLPKYLYDARGFDIKKVGLYAWIPYAAAGVGCLAGGWFSAWLLSKEKSLNFSRKVAMGASVAVMPLILLVPHSAVDWAIVIFSIAFFGQQSWSTLIMILPIDLFPQRNVGSVAGVVCFGGSMGGVVFNLAAGYLLDRGFGWATVFGIVSTFHVTAFLLILGMVREVRPVMVPEPQYA